MAKISKFIIGLIFVSLFVGVFSLFMSGASDYYDVDYDNSTLEVYNKLDELSDHAESIQADTNEIKEDSGVLDIIGDIFSGAYTVLLTTQTSYDIFYSMLNAAFSDVNLGPSGSLFLVAIGCAVLFAVIFAILSAIMKWEL